MVSYRSTGAGPVVAFTVRVMKSEIRTAIHRLEISDFNSQILELATFQLSHFSSAVSRHSMRIGIFGGSFDSVHFGHLLLAECCREQGHLDAVGFVPAAVPPHKQQRELTPAESRIEMLELAFGGHGVLRQPL